MFPLLSSCLRFKILSSHPPYTLFLHHSHSLKDFDYGMDLQKPISVHNKILKDNYEFFTSSANAKPMGNIKKFYDGMVLKKPILVHHDRDHNDSNINSSSKSSYPTITRQKNILIKQKRCSLKKIGSKLRKEELIIKLSI
ncbi:hypothetical protein O181_086764 [Austropuccinia psidii MF-1]|uniref:Uncharacterized protein n=1 Tax=Austropuccinia psidii MF-1 TaxID=1389203 RepID=A0A9Q3FXK8_9BASI|nr:hypothetical protein [Austropuccinia psidii MF-1]